MTRYLLTAKTHDHYSMLLLIRPFCCLWQSWPSTPAKKNSIPLFFKILFFPITLQLLLSSFSYWGAARTLSADLFLINPMFISVCLFPWSTYNNAWLAMPSLCWQNLALYTSAQHFSLHITNLQTGISIWMSNLLKTELIISPSPHAHYQTFQSRQIAQLYFPPLIPGC